MVVAGFGGFAVLGGFALDRRGLQLLGAERRGAELSVLALGVLELSLLSPAAWAVAVVLLLEGSRVMGSMLWPWAVGVPAGTVVVVGLVRCSRRSPARGGGGGG